MMEYLVVTESSALALEARVKLFINMGWFPKGGVSALYIPEDIAHRLNINHPVTFYQAMTRIKDGG